MCWWNPKQEIFVSWSTRQDVVNTVSIMWMITLDTELSSWMIITLPGQPSFAASVSPTKENQRVLHTNIHWLIWSNPELRQSQPQSPRAIAGNHTGGQCDREGWEPDLMPNSCPRQSQAEWRLTVLLKRRILQMRYYANAYNTKSCFRMCFGIKSWPTIPNGVQNKISFCVYSFRTKWGSNFVRPESYHIRYGNFILYAAINFKRKNMLCVRVFIHYPALPGINGISSFRN